MRVNQQGQLTPDDEARLKAARAAAKEADRIRAEFRAVCVEMIEKSSFRRVSELTGVSTNTLQKWKREAR